MAYRRDAGTPFDFCGFAIEKCGCKKGIGTQRRAVVTS